MTTYKFTLNKNDLDRNDLDTLKHYYPDYTPTKDTLKVECYDEKGNITYCTTYYIYKGKAPRFGMCCKVNGKYVFAKYSRYEAIDVDFTDYAIDTDELGNDHRVFTTMHYKIENMETRI